MKKTAGLSLLLLLTTGCGWFSKEPAEQVDPQAETVKRLATLDEKLSAYKELIGTYPTSLTELIDGPADPELKDKWNKALSTEAELIDAWGQPFEYKKLNPTAEDTSPYDLFSVGDPQRNTASK